jgi:uncharacterized protein (DUF58 family)
MPALATPAAPPRPRESPVIPTARAIAAFAAAAGLLLAILIAGVSAATASWIATGLVAALFAVMAMDYALTLRAWRRSPPQLSRVLPDAFAIAARREVRLVIDLAAAEHWDMRLHDHPHPSLVAEGLPIPIVISGPQRVETSYFVIPARRGIVSFAPAQVRVRSRWGLCELNERIGPQDQRRVYPDFSQIARYAWLAGDRRLQEIGIKTYQLRGQGTDFKQLSDYRVGDSVRYIDWRATARLAKPIVREFQDERDQCVMFLIDCGRRLRADDRESAAGTTHFDQVLNAVMLLTYVALKQGDAVGAMTFGTSEHLQRYFAPQKGGLALSALMGQLYDVEPTPTHSDFLAAAQQLLTRHRKRSLIIVVTNFRDEDSMELGQALKLLRSRHLVLLASLRERIVGEMIAQPLVSGGAAIEVASAHLYEQSRRDAFNRLAARDALMVDAEPQLLGVQLVNRYHAVKGAGLI